MLEQWSFGQLHDHSRRAWQHERRQPERAVGAAAPHDDAAANSDPSSSPVNEYAINICGFGLPAAVLQQANALRWLGSAQYELAGLLLILSGQTGYGARLTIEQADGSVTSRELGDSTSTMVLGYPDTMVTP